MIGDRKLSESSSKGEGEGEKKNIEKGPGWEVWITPAPLGTQIVIRYTTLTTRPTFKTHLFANKIQFH